MANEDWDEAVRRVEAVRRTRPTELDLSNLKIDEVPPEIAGSITLLHLILENTQITDVSLRRIAGLTELELLYLTNTRITDAGIAHIAGLRKLQTLSLGNTQVTDAGLSHIAGLPALDSLFLHGTQITDAGLLHIAGCADLRRLTLTKTAITDAGLSHIAGLTALQALDLDNTQITDLRPLRDLPLLTKGPWRRFDCLLLKDTPALSDPAIAAAMAHRDYEEQRKALLAHLRSLPPWPEPLPGRARAEPTVPAPSAAPLDATITNLRLVAVLDRSEQDQIAQLNEAWRALKDHIEDMADLRPGLHNTLPRLDKALARVETALGSSPEECSPIALGTHGTRVVALAALAETMLMDEEAIEVNSLATLLVLHLDQFPEWRAYRDGAPAPSEAETKAALPELRRLNDALAETEEVDPQIPAVLADQIENAEDGLDDPVARRGVMDSAKNVLASVFRKVVAEAKDVAGQGWAATKKTIALAIPSGLLLLIGTQSGVLSALAAKASGTFAWLKPVLAFLGL